jgi:hypothetical protein
MVLAMLRLGIVGGSLAAVEIGLGGNGLMERNILYPVRASDRLRRDHEEPNMWLRST